MVECRWIHHDIIQAQPIQVKRMKAKCSKLIQLATSERGEAAATNALQQATQMRSRNPNLKIIAAIGGWSDAMMYVWSDMAANSNSRTNFANNIFNFLQRFNLNGIDVDWEYPNREQDRSGDKENFIALLQTIKNRLGSA
jgi:chitinase